MAIINDSNRQAITDLVVELREQGVKWDVVDGIRDQVEAKFPTYTSKSAIPLRKLYHNAKGAKFNPGNAKGKKMLVDLREGRHPSCDNYRGAGWAQLEVMTGKSQGELKKLYTEAGGQFPVTGRLYIGADGHVNHVAESTVSIHKSRQPVVEVEVVKAEDTPAETTEAPKPKRQPRRRRNQTAA
jgi:hypothetical protein